MSNPWELMDKELDQAYCLADLHTDRMGHKAIARAAQKQLAEWLSGYDKHYSGSTLPIGQPRRCMPHKDWQSLLKELGV